MEFENLSTADKHYQATEKTIVTGGAPFISTVLPFNMEHQPQSNWCWAATSKSVSKFYSALSPWTQCKIAGAELNKTCCTTPVPSPCNVPWYLDKALTRTNNFVSIQAGAISWAAIKQQLDKGLVVGTRIGWTNGGGHFMVVYGVSTNGITQYVNIDDPIYGKSVLTYTQFRDNYQNYGKWTHTYFTKKYNYFMFFKDITFHPELLKPIEDVRPLIAVQNPEFEVKGMSAASASEFQMPHYAYTIGLNEVQNNPLPKAAPQSLRVIEASKEKPLALFEVGVNKDAPELVQMNVSERYFKQLDAGLGKLKTIAEKNKEEAGEVRFIKVPALNLEAFWLHYDDSGKDVVSPVQKFENDSSVDWNKAYSQQEFTDLLKRLAEKVNTHDDLLGS